MPSNLTAVNLIIGPLGSGKTTLIRQLLNHKPQHEHWVILVNEFGRAGIDGAILSQDPSVKSVQLPGGCICCTAKADLILSLTQVLKTHQPDRILIEPTGLGEPDTLVDTLQNPTIQPHVCLQTVFAVLDSAAVTVANIKQRTIMQNALNMADVIVLNKHDLAAPAQLEALQAHCHNLFPAKKAVLTSQQAQGAQQWLNLTHEHGVLLANTSHHHPTHSPVHHEGVMLPYVPITFDAPVERLYKNELGIQSMGWVFANHITFDWKKLQALFQSLNDSPQTQGVKRAKGVFKVGAPWMLFQWVNHHTTRELITYRRDSRVELLIGTQSAFDFPAFERQLQACCQLVNE